MTALFSTDFSIFFG